MNNNRQNQTLEFNFLMDFDRIIAHKFIYTDITSNDNGNGALIFIKK